MNRNALEVAAGSRFRFGANWARFLDVLDENRITAAEQSLQTMLQVASLEGRRFLDVGSGSGLFSLAARRLGAKVHSFDCDPQSVGCTAELRRRYFPADSEWIVEEGSALNQEYLSSLGRFDVVYSWGVLHHTGEMWHALECVAPLVADGGHLFIAIYNDQGLWSRYWLAVKQIYNSNILGRSLMIAVHVHHLYALRWVIRRMSGRSLERGMDLWRDMLDWLGGYPFEVSRPETIIDFYLQRGFTLRRLKTCGGRVGCNEFILNKTG